MADFAVARYHKSVISSIGPEAPSTGVGNGPASGTWPAANRGIWVPVTISAPFLATKFWWANGATVTGSVDCAVYSANGNNADRLASVGPTDQVGIAKIQSVTLGSALFLTPGSYYLALSCTSGSSTFFRISVNVNIQILMGCAQQANVGTLPSSATLATLANGYLPLFGITNAVVI